MHITGHSFKGDVLDALLDKRLEQLASPQENQPSRVTGKQVFSSVGEDTYAALDEERVSYVLAELQYAADNAKIAITDEQTKLFVESSNREHLRGKDLERAAKKFCNDVAKTTNAPMGTRSLADAMASITNDRQIVSASYGDGGQNDRATGGYMGMKSNPNTIFNPNAIQKIAGIKGADEERAEAKQKAADFKQAQKDKHWKDIEEQLSDPNNLKKTISNASFFEKYATHNPSLGKNVLSMFSQDRDFAGIPEKTAGETIHDEAVKRHEKKANQEPEDIQPARKMTSLMDQLIEQAISKKAETSKTPAVQRPVMASNSAQYKITKAANAELYENVVKAATQGLKRVKLDDGQEYSLDFTDDVIYLSKV
jgi:hypothetical protein